MSELQGVLTDRGFKVFAIAHNSKKPLSAGWQEQALNNVAVPETTNIGVYTSVYKENKALVVIDIDVLKKNGRETFERLKKEGYPFPETFTVKTPTGGYHLYYEWDEPITGGVNVLGEGIDIRSKGQYVVAPGSSIDGKKYIIINDCEITRVPEWIVESRRNTKVEIDYPLHDNEINREAAYKRGSEYLQSIAPKPMEGARNQTGYSVACRLKDFGLPAEDTLSLMLAEWETYPILSQEEVESIVSSAYKHGQNPIGVDAPEKQFKIIETTQQNKTPVERMNEKYAIMFSDGCHNYLCEERKNGKVVRHYYLNESGFKRLMSTEYIEADGKRIPLFDLWVGWPNRREYYGEVMEPTGKCDPKFYNIWRGFPTEEAKEENWTPDQRLAVEMFDRHLLENVSTGDVECYKWIKTYLAQMIQEPWKKPRTSLTIRGKKGTGKSLVVDVMQSIIGMKHSMTVNNLNMLVGDFNGHLEPLILLCLDEVYWGGDKTHEGVLKNLITSPELTINSKYKQPKLAKNYMRIIMTTNAEFTNSATGEERRYTVKSVSDTPCFTVKEFEKFMDIVLYKKGNEAIYHWLMQQDLSEADINKIYETDDLTAQKTESLSPFHQFWLECLNSGRIGEYTFMDEIPRDQFKFEFFGYLDKRKIKSYRITTYKIKKYIKEICPSSDFFRKRTNEGLNYVFSFKSLAKCREDFEKYLNAKLTWDEAEEDNFEDLY